MIFGFGGQVPAMLGGGGKVTKRKYSEVEMIGALKQLEAGPDGRRDRAGAGGVEAHHLCLESEVWRDERGGGAAFAATGG